MAKTNRKAGEANRLAGGKGKVFAAQGPEALLRRSVMTCLLWEDIAYAKGSEVADNIKRLVRQVDLETVSEIASEARHVQKLRHVPLLLVREMARHPQLKDNPSIVSWTLDAVIQRPDELTEFLAIYWQEGRQPLSAQVKKGLKMAFGKFNEYQFAKYDRDNVVKLRDALFLSHAEPTNAEREALYQRIVNRTLALPNTWENRLSAGEDKKAVFTDMLQRRQLGALALLRNLRNMVEAKVHPDLVRDGLRNCNPKWLLPINYLAAAKAAPQFEPEIEALMLAGFNTVAKLPGHTVFILDVSGSMRTAISGKSDFDRIDVAAAMAMTAEATSEACTIYATAGDWNGEKTQMLFQRHQPAINGQGFKLIELVRESQNYLGGGGIFTRQALDSVRKHQAGNRVDRIVIFSDSQDCDRSGKKPEPFGFTNYIVDVSNHTHGVNYDGIWTAEVSGWSDHFIDYIAALEGCDWTQEGDTEIVLP